MPAGEHLPPAGYDMASRMTSATMASGLPPKVEPYVPGVMASPILLEMRHQPESHRQDPGKCNDIRPDTIWLKRKQGTNPADASLNLIGNHKGTNSSAAARTLNIALRHAAGTTLALNRLNLHRGNMRSERITQSVQVAKGDMFKPIR